MGTDIRGWVEVKGPHSDQWHGVIKLHTLLGARNYFMFRWLFGVGLWGYSPMAPLAPERGIPADASLEARADYDTAVEALSPSWATWAEVKTINWDAEIEDRVIQRTVAQEQGPTHTSWKSVFITEHRDRWEGRESELQPGLTWIEGNTEYSVVQTMLRDHLEHIGQRWLILFKMLDALATGYDSDNIRLVVWFDG